jgi:hypothetical protein
MAIDISLEKCCFYMASGLFRTRLPVKPSDFARILQLTMWPQSCSATLG